MRKTVKGLEAQLMMLMTASKAVLDGFNLGRYVAVMQEGETEDIFDEVYKAVEDLGYTILAIKETL